MRECCEVQCIVTNPIFCRLNMSQNSSNGAQGMADPKLFMAAMVEEMRRMMRGELDKFTKGWIE